MAALENMQNRLNYNGGNAQVARMNESKLKSLKKALVASYQAATAVLSDNREFKCLINPDKIKNTYDNKIISIPFEDVCLNSSKADTTTSGIVTIGLKAGDVFTWKENQSKWLVYLQRLEETAYFRAEIRKCNKTVTIGTKTYNVYVRGPEQTMIDWSKGNYEMFNKENYTLLMYITKDETTLDYFHRFTKVEIDDLPWEVQAVDEIATEGIIEVSLKETYQNTIEKELEEEEEPTPTPTGTIYISGPDIVYPYGEETYTIIGASGGSWTVSNSKAEITSQTETTANIEIVTGKSGSFTLKYIRTGQTDISLPVTIESL